MQIRAKIIVKGEVQKVGFRNAVEKIARKLDIKQGHQEYHTHLFVQIDRQRQMGALTDSIARVAWHGAI
ncbi:hypothetical protein C5S30_07860 [ANME-1 cluster archaeon GoMg4]|nr:hypothetical protein [ANME-1 cluster archaeon GoMg4]